MWGDENLEDRPPRPRYYPTDDGVWPYGPLAIGAPPPEARVALSVVRRLTDAGCADEPAHVQVPGVNQADLENLSTGTPGATFVSSPFSDTLSTRRSGDRNTSASAIR